jgi:septal ring factor EnvC (AmiA/AmiB activator)
MKEILEIASRFLPLLVLIIQVLLAWGLWSLSKKFVSREECRECREEARNHTEHARDRLSSVEQAVAVSSAAERVTNDDLAKIYERINAVDRQVSTLSGEMKTINRSLGLIHQHLLEEK